MTSFSIVPKLSLTRLLSSAILLWLTTLSSAMAHEVLPSIADMTQEGDQVTFDVRLNLESFIAGINMTEVADTAEAPQAADYDSLRALEPAALEDSFRAFWPQMAAAMTLTADGVPLDPQLTSVAVGPLGDVEVTRASEIRFTAQLPEKAQTIQVGWTPEFGVLVLRQMGVDAPYDGYLEAGALSDDITLIDTESLRPIRSIPVGQVPHSIIIDD